MELLSDNEYYSLEEEEYSSIDNDINIIDCYCNNNNICLIFCFNHETNQFESINCKQFKSNFFKIN